MYCYKCYGECSCNKSSKSDLDYLGYYKPVKIKPDYGYLASVEKKDIILPEIELPKLQFKYEPPVDIFAKLNKTDNIDFSISKIGTLDKQTNTTYGIDSTPIRADWKPMNVGGTNVIPGKGTINNATGMFQPFQSLQK